MPFSFRDLASRVRNHLRHHEDSRDEVSQNESSQDNGDRFIAEVKSWLSQTRDSVLAYPFGDSTQNMPLATFSMPCETCERFLDAGRLRSIGTSEWFMAAIELRQQLAIQPEPPLCHICWIILIVRLASDEWTCGPDTDWNWRGKSNWKGEPIRYTGLHEHVFYGDMIEDQPSRAPDEVMKPCHIPFVDINKCLVPKRAPDFRSITSWLQTCEATHGHDCKTARIVRGMDREITLIDVLEKRLVRAPGNSRYAALSYVWGERRQLLHTTSNHSVLFSAGGVDGQVLNSPTSPPLAKVITDAMSIAAQVGVRYLWADALCIEQDDQQDKAREISRMASIYNCAALTIIPVQNDDAHAPVPGAGEQPRGPFAEHIAHGLYMSVRPRLMDTIRSSVYSSRGWTFQESFLSRRRLYFTASQVFLRCESAVWSEDFVEPFMWNDWEESSEQLAVESLSGLFRWDFQNHSHSGVQKLVGGYAELIRQYWSRKLAFQSDIMDAFSAISVGLEDPWGARILAGLPEGLFHHALLWSFRTVQWGENTWTYPGSLPLGLLSAAGHLIPSWSWMGWREYVVKNCDQGQVLLPFGEDSASSFSLNPDILPLITHLEIEQNGSLSIIRAPAELYGRDTGRSPCPFAEITLPTTSCAAPPAHNVLRFWAVTATLQSLGLTFTEPVLYNRTRLEQSYGRFGILDAASRRCGTYYGVAVNETSYQKNVELVRISSPSWSETKISINKKQVKLEFDGSYEFGQWSSFFYMLVLYKEGKDTYERLGVGEIHVDAFNAGDLQNKWIRVI